MKKKRANRPRKKETKEIQGGRELEEKDPEDERGCGEASRRKIAPPAPTGILTFNNKARESRARCYVMIACGKRGVGGGTRGDGGELKAVEGSSPPFSSSARPQAEERGGPGQTAAQAPPPPRNCRALTYRSFD